MGKPNIFLGVKLIYDQDGIWIHQRIYIKDLLQRYGMENYNPFKVPMSTMERQVGTPTVPLSARTVGVLLLAFKDLEGYKEKSIHIPFSETLQA